MTMLGHTLTKFGYHTFAGVPCSILKSIINYASNRGAFISASNESHAAAICAGLHLGGKKSVLLCQNSGLTNALSPLSSLHYPFKIPTLGFVSLRGDIDDNDEPQHALMGEITTKLLDDLKIKWAFLSSNPDEMTAQIKLADDVINNNECFFFVVKKGVLTPEILQAEPPRLKHNSSASHRTRDDALPSRFETLQCIQSIADADTALLSTTGYTSRELYTLADNSNHFYMVGSLGLVSSIGLGIAMAKPDKKIIAINADGALLMHLGSIATEAYYQPNNLLHIVLDNAQSESTGGQSTTTEQADFSKTAASFNYPGSYYAHNLNELKKLIQEWKTNPMCTLIHLKTKPGTINNLQRPSITPDEVKTRFMAWLN